MFRRLLLAASCCVLLVRGADPSRAPILVELFTSEGCSSCPPADRLLQQIDPKAIVLSEHVDYWDHQGWKDPYSSHAFTARQEVYAHLFVTDGTYTPEMVIDGGVEFNGSDAGRASAELLKASRRKKADVHIARSPAGLKVEVADAPTSGDIYLALAQDTGSSQVSAGENKGRQLHHVAIVQSIRKIGSVKRGAAFSNEVELLRATDAQRIIVFLQESGQGKVDGAAMLDPVAAK
jgi:hypothetical protein